MRISGTADLTAPPEQVFAALNDPAVLAATIPGCHALEQVSPDAYAMTVTAGVASIKGTYEGRVTLADQQPPTSFTLRASGSGAPGSVDATVGVTLEPRGDGTHLAYDADAVVGGMIGGVGQRMLSGVSRRMAAQFFGAVDDVIRDGVPAAAAEPERHVRVEGEHGAEAELRESLDGMTSHLAATIPVQLQGHLVVAGVAAGAAAALAGVALGWLIGRRTR